MNYNQELPEDVQKRLDDYIERIKNIQWLKPSKELDEKAVDTQVKLVLETFGVKAKIEYKKLETSSSRDAARDAAWDAALDAARDAALDAARGAAWGAARDAAWDAARDAALGAARGAALDAARGAAWGAARDAAWGATWGAALGAVDLLVQDLEYYKKEYPRGNFINMIPLWELGLYPIGVVNGKFLVYVPPFKQDFPEIKLGDVNV